jgi:RND family efflux transporter MFP subunit
MIASKIAIEYGTKHVSGLFSCSDGHAAGMNALPDIRTEHQHQLAATLKSLSLEPAPEANQTPKKGLRYLVLLICVSALAAMAALAVMFNQPETSHPRDIKDLASDPDGNSTSTALEQARLPQDAREGERSADHRPASDVREVTGSGTVAAPRTTTVFSKYEGRITNVKVDPSDIVKAGQTLVTLDDPGARFALDRAKGARIAADLVLAARTIDFAQARATLDRLEILATRDAASRQHLEEARAAFDRASNAVAQARQDLATSELAIRIAQEPVDELTIRAPFAGTVTQLNAHVGDTVLARADSVRESQSLLTVTDTTSMVIDADVAETNIAALRPGLRGEAVLDGFPDRPFAVEVLRLAPVASVEKGTISLRLSFIDPPQGIRPNMAARIRIPLINTLSQTGDIKQ